MTATILDYDGLADWLGVLVVAAFAAGVYLGALLGVHHERREAEEARKRAAAARRARRIEQR